MGSPSTVRAQVNSLLTHLNERLVNVSEAAAKLTSMNLAPQGANSSNDSLLATYAAGQISRDQVFTALGV